ncbi:type II toxin-antitoxin system HicB family antitoxin [Anaerotruncus rubiinfantis]|uniref:type II toxin-antitoxin system HicB family antitoxin n=1 Tax=Anaerotruncus rubiinfantis TaxID=1720200 RepID=UPI0018989B28
MKYVYPAIFTPEGTDYNVTVPDLPGCVTFGRDLPDAIQMARDAMAMWLCDAEDNQEAIPAASDSLSCPSGSFVSLVDCDTNEYRRENDNRAVKKTLTLPSWLSAKAERAGVNFSQVLQDGLKQKLNL